jgi:hypothetical protein
MWRKPLTIQAVRICWRAGCPIKTKPTSGSFPLVNRELPNSSGFYRGIYHIQLICKAKSHAANRADYTPAVAAKSLEIRLRLNGDAGSSLIRFAFSRKAAP